MYNRTQLLIFSLKLNECLKLLWINSMMYSKWDPCCSTIFIYNVPYIVFLFNKH